MKAAVEMVAEQARHAATAAVAVLEEVDVDVDTSHWDTALAEGGALRRKEEMT
jgi:hypothetical protein